MIIGSNMSTAKLKYTDFYLSRINFQNNPRPTHIGEYSEYSAPEFIRMLNYNKPIDVW